MLAPVRGRPGLRALDLGAGTGKLTRLLTDRGVDSVAVEPAAGMREVLARVVPAAAVLPGSAEAIPLPDASVDLVVAGQAFHWFDRAVALPEIARVLRPGGVLGIFYNARDGAVAWVRALSEIIGETGDHAARPGTTCRRTSARCSARPSCTGPRTSSRWTRARWSTWSAPAATRSGCRPASGTSCWPGGRADPDAPGAGRAAILLDAVRDHGRALHVALSRPP